MNISHVSNNKRSAEIVLSRKNKRLKTEEQILWRAKVSEFIKHPISKKKFKARTPFASLPQEMLAHIFDLLRPCDIVKFEQVCKTHTQLTGDSVWKKLRKENHLDFEFAMCQGMSERDRFFFADGVFKYYMGACEKITVEDAPSIYLKFAFLMARFPNLRELILNDLNEHSHKTTKHFSNRKFYQLIYENALAGWAGESLIQGMIVRGDKSDCSTFEYFTTALKGKATCSAILSRKLDLSKSKKLIRHAADQGDYRAMEYDVQISSDFFFSLYNKNRHYPPVLWYKGILLYKENKYREADHFFEEAIKGYLKKGQPPPLLLQNAADNKENLGNLQGAENLYDWALRLEPMPRFVHLYEGGRMKFKLGKSKEAEPLVDQALALSINRSDKERANLFYVAGLIKLNLKNFPVAKELLNKNKSINYINTNKINLMIQLATANIGLGEFDEAKECLKQALELYDSTKPEFLGDIAYKYILLEDWPETERLYERCVKDYSLQSKQVPMDILINLSFTRYKQNKLEESIQLLLQITDSWEAATPPNVHEIIAERYMLLRRWKEAETHFDKALEIRCEEGTLFPKDIFEKAYHLKIFLKDSQRTFDFLDRMNALIEALGTRPTSLFLQEIINIGWQLNRWEDLAKYYPEFIKILQSENIEGFDKALTEYAFVLEMIGRLDDSIALLKQIEAKLNDKLPAEIREQMLRVYFKLKDFEKLHEFYEMNFETIALERSPIPLEVIQNTVLFKMILKKPDIEDYLKKMISYQESLGVLSFEELFYVVNTATRQQFWELADDCCKKALATPQIEKSEQFFYLLGCLAIVKKHRGLAEESASLLKQLIELPNSEFKIKLLFDISQAFAYQKDRAEEEICLEELMKMEGVMEVIRQSLAKNMTFSCLHAVKLSHKFNLHEEVKNYMSLAEKNIECMDIEKDEAFQQLAAYKEKYLQNS